MKASLGLLAGLTACILAENCDPIAYEQSNPSGLSETKDPEVMKNLNKYLEDSRCHMLSDESEQNVEEQKKNLKTLEPTSTSKFTVTENNSADFLTRFSGHRLLYLREVTFRPDVSATYDLKGNEVDDDVDEDDDRVFCRESADEVRERDESFTRQMQFLFDILQRVEKQAGNYHAPGRYRLTIYNPIRRTENEDACPHRYMTSWRVRLLAKDLPPITSIRSFRIVSNDRKGYEYEYPPWNQYAYTYRLRDNYSEMQESKLDLRVLIDLATSMPNLEYLGTRTGGYEWCKTLDEEEDPCSGHYEHDWAGPRRDARHDFAAAVTSCVDKLPKTLRRATLDFLYPLSRVTDYDHGTLFPDLVGSNLTYDPFSTSLGILCNNLRHLQLRAMIDESIFPALSPQNSATSHAPWPHLELLDLMFHNARPDGTWYFQGTDGRGDVARGLPVTDASYPPYSRTQFDEDMDEYYVENIRGGRQTRGKDNYEFRIAPHANLILLLERFARAAIQMPALKEAVIWSPIKGQNVYPERPMGSQRDLDTALKSSDPLVN
ncbi:hypothetical protein J4E93_008220 [Alternaria ventricosa]|uniref:uncharacterized protein n=1 Tax=Alternaria ventricosa TaxID=1187951 RepID=UPI0020C3934F|nr:uncharacterized protein J4E93_008220 [Alternaria ventricosa]KAI4640630.1 hypothetical protein J4E93_008220 [Alternaria ventricosa]